LLEEAEGKTKFENAQIIKEGLEALVGVIPGLLEAEVGINENGGDYHACLNSKFESMEALKAYDVHPEHEKVRDFVTKVRESRVAVDYEI
jgi:antibiotic biosynthesis monooxygenase (ABM) superfamily enzyme